MPLSDNRGVSEVIGAVILFGFLVIALSTYQAVVVPQLNSQTEFDSYMDAREDLATLQNNVILSGNRGVSSETQVEIGTRYPQRTLALNPPPASGRLRTVSSRDVSFANMSAVETEAGNTKRYWNGSDRGFTNATSGIVFSPGYNEFDAQPVVVTGETISVIGSGGVSPLAGQSLLSGDRLQFTFLNGTVDGQGTQVSVAAVPSSTASRVVTVTGDGGPLTLRLDPPPEMTAETWVGTYADRLLDTNDRVERVESDGGRIEIFLAEDRVYRLQLARVVVGTQDISPENHTPKYVIAQQGDDQSVVSGQRAGMTAEVRDRFNNPVTGAEVEFKIVEGDARFLDESDEPVAGNRTIETDGEGRANMKLIVEGADNNVVVTATVVNESTLDVTDPLASTEFEIQVSQSPGQQEGAGAYLVSVSQASAASPDDSNYGMRYILGNQDDERDMTITRFRVERATTSMSRFDRRNDPSPWNYPLTIDVNDDGTVDGYVNVNKLDIGTTYSLDQQATLAPGEEAVFRNWQSSNPGEDMTGDFVEVTIWFTMEGSNEEVSATTQLFLF
jgi:hypothetical protein